MVKKDKKRDKRERREKSDRKERKKKSSRKTKKGENDPDDSMEGTINLTALYKEIDQNGPYTRNLEGNIDT